MKKVICVSTYVEPETYQKLKEIAKNRGISLSALIRMIIREKLFQ